MAVEALWEARYQNSHRHSNNMIVVADSCTVAIDSCIAVALVDIAATADYTDLDSSHMPLALQHCRQTNFRLHARADRKDFENLVLMMAPQRSSDRFQTDHLDYSGRA